MSLLLSILLIASAHCASAQTATVNVDPPYKEVDVGVEFTVTINITNVEAPGLYAYEIKLCYNNTLLNATSAEYPSGHFLDGVAKFEVPIEINREAGYVVFGVSLLGDVPGKTGSGILATVNFTGTGLGVVPLEIKEVSLLDPYYNPPDHPAMDYIANDGVVKVIPEFTPALVIFTFMAITLVAIMLKKLNTSKKHHANHPITQNIH